MSRANQQYVFLDPTDIRMAALLAVPVVAETITALQVGAGAGKIVALSANWLATALGMTSTTSLQRALNADTPERSNLLMRTSKETGLLAAVSQVTGLGIAFVVSPETFGAEAYRHLRSSVAAAAIGAVFGLKENVRKVTDGEHVAAQEERRRLQAERLAQEEEVGEFQQPAAAEGLRQRHGAQVRHQAAADPVDRSPAAIGRRTGLVPVPSGCVIG